MSTTVDQKVVEMRFDNKHFENNVSTTLSTLDKLKQKLNLTGASKGLENISDSANKVNMNGLTAGIQTVHSKFSALEVMGVTALANITNSAINAGKRIVSALTIDPIKTGFSEYETKINAIQTIMSNTSSKGTTMDDVTKVLNELNTYADKTIYNFAEMTRNIGTFTAAGVSLKDSASAIQGIANLAAASGSTSQQASTAMYQLSQALAAGSVKLMDWNSVVNAGMGGQKFQEALKATARDHGVAVDKIIKKQGSFRNSLQEGWLTADILNETLSKFTVEGATEYANAMKKSGKWTKKQADALIKEAQAMEDAATKVKTFTQLWSTLQESAQSGWAQTWEIIVGNFDEAKELLTEVSDVIGGVLNKSAEARNKVLQEWKDLGGRKAIVDSLKNTFEAIVSIVTPIKEAFREIFPPITAKQLLAFSEGLKNLTAKFKLSDESAAKLKSAFKGFFSVIDIGLTIIKKLVSGAATLLGNFTDIAAGVLTAAGALGDWLSNIRKSVNETGIFSKCIETMVGFLQRGIDKIKELGKQIFNYSGFLSLLQGIWGVIVKIGTAIGKVLGESLREGDLVAIVDLFNTGILSGILLGINKFISNFSGAFENVGEVLDSLKGILESYQRDLQAKTLMKIASAIGILAVSLLILASIKEEKMSNAITAMTLLFGELLGALAIFGKISPNLKNIFRASTALISLSWAMLVLSAALKIMSTMNWSEMGVALISMGVGLGALVGAIYLLPEKKATQGAKAIKKLSSALLILSVALKIMSTMSWKEMGIALISMVTGLGALVGALHLLPKNTGTKALGMIALATSMVILASALKIMATMSWNDIGRGLTVMAGALAEIVIAMNLLPKNMISKSTGMLIMATSLVIMGGALKILATMSWDEIGRGLTVLGGALLELVIAMNLMKGALAGAAALLIASASLVVLATALKVLGSMSWESIGKALIGLAGAFVIIGIAGYALAPIIPTILGLAAAFALFGVATLGIGVGLGLIATGITALAVAISGGVTAIVAGLTAIILGVAGIVPELIKILGDAIVVLCHVIIESAPLIAETVLTVVDKIFQSLANHAPSIVTSLLQFLIGVLQSLRDHVPELIVTAMEFIGAFFKGIIDALKTIDTTSLLQGTVAIGLLTGIMFALSSLTALVPSAMLGILGLGALIAELALVLAAVGGLAQIPGLNWLITEGGYLLENIGTAIGKFIGGIAGGILSGATSSLPIVGTNLAEFMNNIQPFIDGAKNIDASMMEGVNALVKTMLLLTGANIIEGLTSFLTGGSSFSKFGQEIAEFGPNLKQYSDAISGVDPSAIKASAEAAKALAEMTSYIPNSGGIVSWFTGENSIAQFASELPLLGRGLKGFSDSITGIAPESIIGASQAAKALADMTAVIPNSGGMVAWFTGDNSVAKFALDLITLGYGLKRFSDSIMGIVPENLIAASSAAKAIADMTATIPNSGGMVAWFTGENSVARFANDLIILGYGLKGFSNTIVGIIPENITAAANAAKALAEMTTYIPNSGGMVAWFTGDNSVSKFASELPVLGFGLKMFSDSIEGIVPENLIAASNAAKTLAEMASVIPNEGGVVAWFAGDSSIAKFATELILLGYGLKGFATNVEGINAENVTAAAGAAKALAEMTAFIPKEGGIKAWFTGETSIANFADKLPDLGKGLKSFSDSVEGINPENITSASSAAKSLGEMTSTIPKNTDKIVDFGENLKSFGTKLAAYFSNTSGISAENITTATNAIKAIKDITSINSGNINSLAEAITNIIESVKNMASVTKASAENFNAALKTLAENGAKNLLEGFKNTESDMEKLGDKASDAFIIGFEDNQTTAINSCETFVIKCADAIKGKSSSFESAGRSLVQGFANGISINTYLATAKAKVMASAAISAAKNELDINSPSKVFRKIGSGVPEGFAQGIAMFGSKVRNSVVTMSDTAISGTNNVISRIVDAINSDMDTQPTIRPILDLSNVESGVGTLNGMFNGGPSIGVMSNLNAISSGMNAKIQNGVNSDVISAIDKLGRNLGKVGGNTYNINGVTYDDGSNISDAVEALIRAAQVERRI